MPPEVPMLTFNTKVVPPSIAVDAEGRCGLKTRLRSRTS